ncbi:MULTISPECIES: methylated-DNA--[protein]-cysteine S-methyltransferase [Brevibacillus]|uniref:methylated-DNA--[protein]-cysteine S-methyltransferase n=1 Tax=Brevibacillus sp. FSL L8-0710 TaxID=2975313 RepID=UPI0030F5E1F1
MSKLYKLDYDSPIGVLELISSDDSVLSIMFREGGEPRYAASDDTSQVLKDCYRQMEEYFQGKRREFTFPYTLDGTGFQKTVWEALTRIPYAQTVAYKDIAADIGNEKAIRAVGHANSKNTISIVVPCHRVIGSDRKLTGYAGGIWRKEWLIQHEKTFRTDQ